MERLGEDARRLLEDAGVPEMGRIADVTAAWPSAVGAAIARSAWPLRVGRDGTLHVATISSTWAFELDRLAPEIAVRLQAAIGPSSPTRLRFAPGPVPEPAAESPDSITTAGGGSLEPPPGVVGETGETESPELGQVIARARAAAARRKSSNRPF